MYGNIVIPCRRIEPFWQRQFHPSTHFLWPLLLRSGRGCTLDTSPHFIEGPHRKTNSLCWRQVHHWSWSPLKHDTLKEFLYPKATLKILGYFQHNCSLGMSRSFTQHAICMCFLKLWRDCPPQGLLPRAISNNSSTAALILALTWTRGQSGFVNKRIESVRYQQTERACDATLYHIWNNTTGALHIFITFFYLRVMKIAAPAPLFSFVERDTFEL